MIANWVKAVWILVGGTAAAAATAYVSGVFEPSPGSPRVEAAIQQPAATQTGTGKDAPATAEAPAAGEQKAPDGEQQMASLPPDEQQAAGEQGGTGQAAAEPAAEPELILPAFDLVRVEPNGSVVIAGTAAANSSVELIAGATVIGTAKAGPSGDFAVVLDEPLKPGDYTVVLRSTTGDNVVTTSAQTAIIAVPETETGQVLALVEEPGAPSRLITVPSAPKAEQNTEMAAKGDRPAAAATSEAVTSAEATAPAEEPKPEMQATAPETEAPATAPRPEPEMQAEAEKQEETAPAEVAEAGEQAPAGKAPVGEEQMAAVEEPAPAPPQPAEMPETPRVAVEAVEIEGRNVFVAGYAEVGSTVRVYANDILLGQVATAESGRFLIEAERDLPVGDYIVRADMLSDDKSEVIAHAAVPFEREPGERLAAVAPQQPAVQQPKPQASEEQAAESGEPKTPEEPVKQAENAQGAPEADTSEAKPAGEMAASAEPETAPESGGAKPAESMAAAGQGADASQSDKQAEMAAVDTTGGESDAAATQPTAPKLENVGGAVIIRRGDTLWRLSRRVYGRGIRYTTIYLANQGQIADPDMIWPGQVFSVPGETDEGETADMSAIAEQVADPDDVAAEEVVTR